MSRVSESEFYMWRTLFAIAHADNIVTDEEIRFMVEILEDVPFTDEQLKTLTDDIAEPKDIVEMFEKISDIKDQAKFFKFARELVWVDGDYGKEEQAIMLELKRVHLGKADVDELIGKIDVEFEEDERPPQKEKSLTSKKRTPRDIVFSFRERFLKEKGIKED